MSKVLEKEIYCKVVEVVYILLYNASRKFIKQ